MKKRWMSLLLALVLSLTLLPTAALADNDTPATENTPPTGVYTALNTDGTPSGTYYKGSRPNENGPWGYWNIPYTSGSETILYYYDAESASLSTKRTGISVESISEHLWKLTITGSAGSGNFTADFKLAEDNGFPISFQDNRKPEPGLYYRPLRGVNDDHPYVNEDDPYSNEPIQLSPYVDRKDIATYFYDGEVYTPVDVTFGPSLSVDPVKAQNHTGWYIFAAYDFCEGTISYTHEGTTYHLNVSTHLPEYGFYVKGTTTASEKAYRMYTIAEENTSTDESYSSYRFYKTLTFMPSDPEAGLGLGPNSGIDVRVTCQQRKYLPNGSEVDSIDYNDFAYSWEAVDNTIELTLYTNDSDVMCFLNGTENDDWKFGSYVNVLAPIRQNGIFALLVLRTNDLGKPSAAKFLPKHLFVEAAGKAFGITLSAGDFAADVTFDPDQTAAMAEKANAALEVTNADLSEGQRDAITVANVDAEIKGAVDLGLSYDGTAQHELDGTATISYPCELALDDGETVKVCYVADDGTTELIDATYENGTVTFTTDHFSTFAVITLPAPAPAPSTSGGSSSSGSTTITVPVSSDHASVNVKAEVKKGTATVKVSDKQIEKVAADHAGEVTIDVSGLKNVESATVPSHVVEKTNEAENTGLTVSLPAGSVSLDETALESVTETANGKDVTVSVVSVSTANLSHVVKDIIGMEPTVLAVVDVNVTISGKKQSSFDGGKVTISVPYTPKAGEDTSKLTVWFVKDDGTIENKGGWYDTKNKCFVFETDHLSQYLLVNPNEAVSFVDVPADAYFYDAVKWAASKGITGGTDDTHFSPYAACTRGQLVTFLWRAAGEPAAKSGVNPFADVKNGAFYQAILWAAENGIVTGYSDGTFRPGTSVTRQQIAAILYRYATYAKMDVSVGEDTNILSFNDATSVSDYAVAAIQWAVNAGVMQGYDGNLMPDQPCTRAQIVTMLYRLLG